MRWKFGLGLALGFALSVAPHGTRAQGFLERTSLISVDDESSLSQTMREVSIGGYLLSDGTPVRFRQWYSSDTPNLSVTWLTEVTPNFGLFWGFGTGESGEKYRIDPSVTLGFIAMRKLSRSATLSLSATTILGGDLREGTCTADYGAIGGIQTVNCRLAATPMPPAATLDYLFDESPPDRTTVTLRYVLRF